MKIYYLQENNLLNKKRVLDFKIFYKIKYQDIKVMHMNALFALEEQKNMDYYKIAMMFFVIIASNNGELKQYQKIKEKCLEDV